MSNTYISRNHLQKYIAEGFAGQLRLALKDEDTIVASEQEIAGEVHFSLPVASPKLWSEEAPNLYDLELSVVNAEGDEVEFACEKVGFRRFEIIDCVMHLNGKRIIFKGADRHDCCAVLEWKVRRDLITMKQKNINAICTSHYPNGSCLYRIADELGMYVIDEANMESHGVWDMCMRVTGRWSICCRATVWIGRISCCGR